MGDDESKEFARKTANRLLNTDKLSLEDQHNARRRKYALMMATRVVCLVLAAVFHRVPWLMAILAAAALALPWMAVLIANDRPPRKAEEVNRYEREPTLIENDNHRVIDG